jgi:hypothetical protein
MTQALTRSAGSIRLSLVAVAVMVIVAAAMPSISSAENPLYCNREANINVGCEGPLGLIRVNESRNESGGCIAEQWWTRNDGYLIVTETCGGKVLTEELTHEEQSFPKCWNRTNAEDLIHCRYASWST